MTTATSTAVQCVYDALRLLSGRDEDFAATRNDIGFNGRDSQFGNSLAQQLERRGTLSAAQITSALWMLRTYERTQLAPAGITLPTADELRIDLASEAVASLVTAPKPPQTPVAKTGLIDIQKNRVTFQMDAYYPDLVAIAREIPTRQWLAPYNVFDLVMLDRVLAAFPTIERSAAVIAEMQRRDEAACAARALAHQEQREMDARVQRLMGNLGDLTRPMPDGRTLRMHQRTGVEWGVEQGSGIIADDMGLGKTMTALMIARAHRVPVFVLCPKSLRENWLREAKGCGVPVAVHSWSKVPPRPLGNFVLIADEAHYAQNIRAKRTQAFLDLAAFADAVLVLTGTPLRNGRPAELFPLLKAIRHPIANNKPAYEKRYCAAKATRFTEWDVTGAAYLDELHAKIASKVLRRKKEDCLDIPIKDRILRPAEVSAKAEAAYQALFEQKRAEYETKLAAKAQRARELGEELMELRGKLSRCTSLDEAFPIEEDIHAKSKEQSKLLNAERAEALVMLGILRQAGALAKSEEAIRLAEEVISQESQVVLFTESREVARAIGAALRCEVLDGDAKDRQGMVDRFQDGTHKAMVCTFKAGGVGITLTAATVNILVDRPFTAADAEQGEDRIYRIGQTKPTTMVWLQYGKVDQKIDTMLVGKARAAESIIGGKAIPGGKVQSIADISLELLDELFHGKGE